MDNIEHMLYYDEQIYMLQPPRHSWRHFDRVDPFEDLRDDEFRIQYQFTKRSVEHLVDILSPHLTDDPRSHCLTPLQQVLLTLSSLGGDEFQRISARMVRCSQSTVSKKIGEVIDALVLVKPDYVRLPTMEEERESAEEIKRRFHLENFPYGINCIHMIYNSKPRKVMNNMNPTHFYNRKGRYSMNVQVIGDAYHNICDVNVRHCGSVHDATIWDESGRLRSHLFSRPYFWAGDAAYPLSDTLMKPFPDPSNGRECLFNFRLCQARVVMTENLFGIWKRRFPILTNMRFNHLRAMKTVVATAVLMNFGTSEGDISMEHFPPLQEEATVPVEEERPRAQVLEAGHQTRQRIMNMMRGPCAAAERAVWAGHR